MASLAKRAVTHFRMVGFWRTALYALYCLEDAYRCWRWGIGSAMRATRLYVKAEEADLPNEECVAHQPTTSLHAFRVVMERYIVPRADDVFLDYGSGAGRVVIMAATYPFRRVIGVEYCGQLVRTATEILEPIRHRLSCANIQLVQRDARDYEVPPDVTVMYFYNPFTGQVLRSVCERIRESLRQHPRNLRILCFRPEEFKKAVAGCDWLVQRVELRIAAFSPDTFAVFESIPRGSEASRRVREGPGESRRANVGKSWACPP